MAFTIAGGRGLNKKQNVGGAATVEVFGRTTCEHRTFASLIAGKNACIAVKSAVADV